MRAWLARRDQPESNRDLAPNDVRVILGLAPFLLLPAYLTFFLCPGGRGLTSRPTPSLPYGVKAISTGSSQRRSELRPARSRCRSGSTPIGVAIGVRVEITSSFDSSGAMASEPA
jgi:hypothetical protein